MFYTKFKYTIPVGRKEWNSLVDEALFYKVPAKHIKVIKYYKIIKVSHRIGTVKDTLSGTEYYDYKTFIGSAGRLFLAAIDLAIDVLKGLIEIYQAIVEPKSRHDEKTYKKYQKVYVVVSNLEAKRGSAYSRKNQLETKLSVKDYKLIGGKKKLQTEIQSLENEIKGISSKINKAVKEVGEDSLRDFESHYRYLERLKDDYEYGKKRLTETKLHHEDRVKEYMADVKDLNVELQENIKTDRLSEKSKTTLSQYDRLRSIQNKAERKVV